MQAVQNDNDEGRQPHDEVRSDSTARQNKNHQTERETKMKAKLGSGSRFRALARKVHSKALAAYIGRKKYGAKRFAQLSAGGRHHTGTRHVTPGKRK